MSIYLLYKIFNFDFILKLLKKEIHTNLYTMVMIQKLINHQQKHLL